MQGESLLDSTAQSQQRSFDFALKLYSAQLFEAFSEFWMDVAICCRCATNRAAPPLLRSLFAPRVAARGAGVKFDNRCCHSVKIAAQIAPLTNGGHRPKNVRGDRRFARNGRRSANASISALEGIPLVRVELSISRDLIRALPRCGLSYRNGMS